MVTITSDDYEISVKEGWLLINGTVAEDYLDCLDRTYTAATPSQVNRELTRMIETAFRRGREAQAAETPPEPRRVGVPIVGKVD
jgi:hypothetical protein